MYFIINFHAKKENPASFLKLVSSAIYLRCDTSRIGSGQYRIIKITVLSNSLYNIDDLLGGGDNVTLSVSVQMGVMTQH